MAVRQKIDWAESSEVAARLAELDFEFWFKKITISAAKKHIEKLLKKRVRPSMFKELRQTCKWWKNSERPHRPPSNESLLDAKGWESLRTAVRNSVDLLHVLTLDEAVAVVSIQCRCNRKTLSGLNSDMRVWKQ